MNMDQRLPFQGVAVAAGRSHNLLSPKMNSPFVTWNKAYTSQTLVQLSWFI